MGHYKRMYDDKEYLYAFDLDGREVTITIEKVLAGELQGDKGRKTRKPMIAIVGKTKKLALNKTNGKTIASLYGTDTDEWAGKQITIYPTTTDFGGETVECIRVRPTVPTPIKTKGGNGRKMPADPSEPAAPELTDEDKRAIVAAEASES